MFFFFKNSPCRCYWFNNGDTNLAHYQADERCRRWNGHLVTIGDMVENQYLFDSFPAGYTWVWIGLTDTAVEDEFRQVNPIKAGIDFTE